jgi:outer membrane protein assembly factor BamB
MKTRCLALVAVCLLLPLPGPAADWPQFRGPNRDGRSEEKGLLQSWPEGGPKVLWTYKGAGLGFSSPSIIGDRLYTLGARGDTTYAICVNVKDGTEIWSAKLGPIFTFEGNTWGDGPRSTPTVDGDLLFALGGYGDLVCFETAKGKEVWRKSFARDFGGELMTYWGYSESPLVDGDKVVVTPGGPGGTIAALDKKTGRVVWRSKELTDKATYSSLRVATIGGVRQYVGLTFISDGKGSAIVGVAAADGKLLWYEPFPKAGSYAVAPTPLVRGNLVYATSGYGAGCKLLEITRQEKGKFVVKELYNADGQRTLKNTHGGVVLVGEHVYGHSESTGWVCQDFKTGKKLWAERRKLRCRKSGSIIYGDGRLYLYSDEGSVALLKPSAKRFEEVSHFDLPQKSKAPEERQTSQAADIWTHPVIANGRLYLRDQELLFCFDIRAAK